jgi:hypothetical protein
VIFGKVSDTHEKSITKITEANLSCFAEGTANNTQKDILNLKKTIN